MVFHTLLDIKLSPLPLMVRLVMSLRLVPDALLLTLDGDQENQFHLLLFNYQNALVLLFHQVMVFHTLLVTRPSPLPLMVRLVTSSRLVPDASLLTLDGDQESQFHLLLSKCKDYQNALVPIDHQDMVSHTLLVIKPSPLPLMVLLVMSLKLVPHASLLTLDGDQENQYQVKCQKIPPLLTLDKMDTMHQKTTFLLIL
jgi:hypothetical protein